MAAWLIVLPSLLTVVVLSLGLLVARKLADRFASDQFSLVRTIVFLVVTAALVGVTAFLRSPWLFASAASALAFWMLVSLAFDMRAGPLQSQLGILQFYVFGSGLQYAFFRSRGLIDGTSPTRVYEYSLDSLFSELLVPLAAHVVPKTAPVWALPTTLAGGLAHDFSSHVLEMVALGTLAATAFAAAYLSERPMPAPGASLLPVPTVLSGVFGVLVSMAWLAPVTVSRGCSLGALLLAPFYLAESLVLLHRWLRPLRSRTLLLLVLLSLAIWAPVLGYVLVFVGWLAQLLRLRELLPFAALVERPIGRPRPGSLLGVTLAMVLLFAISGGSSYAALKRASPKLGAPAEVCGGVTSSVSWKTRTVTFATADGKFEMDVDESELPAPVTSPDDLDAACRAHGKRLCTSDEWYLACLCTYPRDAEPGAKLGANYFAAARAEKERASKGIGAEASTLTSDKQSEVRSLLSGRAEAVSGAPGASILVAGPSEGSPDVFTEDCRQRALVSARALGGVGREIAGLRCCR